MKNQFKYKLIPIYLKSYYIRLIYRNYINIVLGSFFYCNYSGFFANLVGNYILNKNKKIVSLDVNEDIKSDFEFLNKHGYVKIKNNPNLINITNKIQAKFENEICNIDVPKSLRVEITSINNLNFYSKFSEVGEILINSHLSDILKCYYKSNYKIINTHIYRILSKSYIEHSDDSLYGSTEKWHTDGSTTDSLKIFVLLNKTSAENGPMFLINKSDSENICKLRRSYNNKFINKTIYENKLNVISFEGEIGDMLIVDTNKCLHKATEPAFNKTRDMLVFYASCSKTNSFNFMGVTEQFYGFKRILNSYYE